jgi:hypothetical protein
MNSFFRAIAAILFVAVTSTGVVSATVGPDGVEVVEQSALKPQTWWQRWRGVIIASVAGSLAGVACTCLLVYMMRGTLLSKGLESAAKDPKLFDSIADRFGASLKNKHGAAIGEAIRSGLQNPETKESVKKAVLDVVREPEVKKELSGAIRGGIREALPGFIRWAVPGTSAATS